MIIRCDHRAQSPEEDEGFYRECYVLSTYPIMQHESIGSFQPVDRGLREEGNTISQFRSLHKVSSNQSPSPCDEVSWLSPVFVRLPWLV